MIDRTAFDVLHHEVRNAVGRLTAVKQSSNVRVVQIREDLHLVAKTPPDGVATKTRVDQLDCNLLAVMFVVAFGEIDDAHTAVTDLAHDFISADTRTNPRDVLCEPKTSGISGALFDRVVIR